MANQERKHSSVRHTRAIQSDRRMHQPAAPPPDDIERWMNELVYPAAQAQMSYCRTLGLRQRVLTLPVMVALLVSLVWRQIGSARELVRVLAHERLLWVGQTQVSQQGLSQRLHTFPAELFERVLMDLLVEMHQRWQKRTRPLPVSVARARQHFERLLILDGSTLDGLLRKLEILQTAPMGLLAGRIGVLLDLSSRLPVNIWNDEDPAAHDGTFMDRAEKVLRPGDLLLIDRGFLDYRCFDRLTDQGVGFITRPKSNTLTDVTQVLQRSAAVHDSIIRLGGKNACTHPMRLVEVLYRGKWYRYLTNILDPTVLPPLDVADLYGRRWRVEDAFRTVKRLLGLSFIWAGSVNAIQLQVWATWLVYTMLVDLTDAVADRLGCPFDTLSTEMTFRALYHYCTAVGRGDTRDVVTYLADEAHGLALIKRVRSNHLTSSGDP